MCDRIDIFGLEYLDETDETERRIPVHVESIQDELHVNHREWKHRKNCHLHTYSITYTYISDYGL